MKDNIIIENKFLYDFNYLNKPRKFHDLLLYQLGEIYVENNAIVNEHVHDRFFELTYIISGKGITYAGDFPQEIKKNDLFLSLPYERHEIISDATDPLRYYYVALSFEPDSPFNEILYNNHLVSIKPNMRLFNTPTLEATFVNLLSALQSNAPYSELKFEMLLKTFCINVYQIYYKATTMSYTSPAIDSEQNLYFKIMKYIDNNLLTINKLTDITDDLHYNYVYLSRIFKKKFGKSIYAYYSMKKLDLAKQLIEDGKMSITAISEHLNYSSLYVFSRIYKKHFGISPNTYRQQLLTEKK